jgi:UDP-hydrolysing UDP-N-acetyl-D-glucosamine 2-epimerase
VIEALEAEGVEVEKLDMANNVVVDSASTATRCLTSCMDWLGTRFKNSEPDMVLILGDRYETLGAAHVATLFGLSIAHIHGGETTEGSFDNAFRNAISMMSDLHFVSAEEHGLKLFEMGADPEAIFVVGAPGIDNIVDLPAREFPDPYFLVTYHPETWGKTDAKAVVDALNGFPDYEIVWTGVNADPGGDEIREVISKVNGVFATSTMDNKRYLSAVKYATACVGNSSSFLIEAPALCVPTVNIGRRQDGRLRGPSVIDCEADSQQISWAIQKAISYRGEYTNPYGQPGASKKIAQVLKEFDS